MTEQPTYEGLLADWPHQQRAIAGVVALLGVPRAYCDVGCGSGATVEFMSHHADIAVGFERDVHELTRAHGSPPRGRLDGFYLGRAGLILEWDLAQPLVRHDVQYDLVTSWEVGEHIEPAGAEQFVENVCSLVAPDGWLVFTAALPGQIGTGHVNCQPKEYWGQRFYDRGLRYDAQKTDFLTVIWDHTVNPLLWLRDNVQVWRRTDG